MSDEEVKRLDPTPSTIKKLFAYSGNQCAMPDCREFLVDETGAMLGKIARHRKVNRLGTQRCSG